MAENNTGFLPPAPLDKQHDIADFHSGEPSLDNWLRERALKNAILGATKTYVVCPSGCSRVIGYYALCMGQILGKEITSSMRRNMPTHIPAVVLGRLAVDQDFQKHGLGQALLFDAVSRTLKASEEVSVRLMVVHAISAQAESFYQKNGFKKLPVETSTYALDLAKYKAL